jgi:hypothetical protein
MSAITFIMTILINLQIDCDDQLYCTEDRFENGKCQNTLLEGYCLIDNTCYKPYDVSEDGCGVCLPKKDPYGWSNNADDDLVCTEDKKDEKGNCLHLLKKGFCLIDHTCILDGTEDTNGCRKCDTSISTTEWTNYKSGTPCDDGLNCTKEDHCDGEGNCVGIPYSCDDGIDCTLDLCDGKGGCANPIKNNYCLINGQCIPDLMASDENSCRYCNALINQRDWTKEAQGKRCDDKDDQTPFDYCDQNGNCIGYLYDPYKDAGEDVVSDTTIEEVGMDIIEDEKIEIEREGCSCTLIQ